MLGTRYRLRRKLAEGGMAEIFLADYEDDEGLVRQVVVKRILHEFSKDTAFVTMFMTEAKLISKFNHPNIVKLTDFGIDEGRYYLAMEYIDGFSLRALRRRTEALGRPVPLDLAARMVSQACEGLASAHAFAEEGRPLHLVHRDISPENLLIGRNGVVKVADFGIAKVEGQVRTTRTGMVKGKLFYMAPEQLKAEAIDHRVDIFAMGIVLYELCTGRRPFEGANDGQTMLAVIDGRPAPLITFRDDAPPALQQIVDRAMATRPEDRFQTATALQQALERFSSKASPQALAVFVADIAPSDAVVEAKTSVVAPSSETRTAVVEAPAAVTSPLPPASSKPRPPPRIASAAPVPVAGEPTLRTGDVVSAAGLRRSPRGALIAAGIGVLVLGAFLLGRIFSGGGEPPVEAAAVAPAPEPPSAVAPVAPVAPTPVAEAPEPQKAAAPVAASPEPAAAEPKPSHERQPPERPHHVAAATRKTPAPVAEKPVRQAPVASASAPVRAAEAAPVRHEPDGAKNSGATEEWAGLGTPPTRASEPAPAAQGLVGRVTANPAGVRISNDSNFTWHRCQVRLPNAKFFDFYDTAIDAHREVIIRSEVLVADPEAADAYVIQGYAQLRCTEGRKYILVD